MSTPPDEPDSPGALTVEEFLGPKPMRRADRGGIEITYVDDWNGGMIVAQKITPTPEGASPFGAEIGDVHGFLIWLMVLASPPLYRTLVRIPDRDHLLRLLDTFIAYAARGHHVTSVDPPTTLRLAERDGLARSLRVLLATWTPPVLPGAITDAARDLVEAEGLCAPEGGWDNLKHDKPYPLDDVLLWPEGIPVAQRGAAPGGGGG